MKRTVQSEQRKQRKKTVQTGWQAKKGQRTGRGEESAKTQTVPGEWLYLAPQGVDAARIAEALAGTYETELWGDAGVVEVVLGEKQSVDIEHTEVHPRDEVTRAYVSENGCKEVFLVTFAAEKFGCVESVMKLILAQCGGLFCGDTEDFSPVVRL